VSDLLSLFRPVLDAALLGGHRAAAAPAGRAVPALVWMEKAVVALAGVAPMHQRDLGLTLAGVGVDGRAVVGVLVRVEVDGDGTVRGLNAPFGGFIGGGGGGGCGHVHLGGGGVVGGGVLGHGCRHCEVEGEEGDEGFDCDHLDWLVGV
jgi:hypothetical protein